MEILQSIAYQKNQELVLAYEASSGNAPFSCPNCSGELILKKGKSIGKWSKRPHFAHKSVSLNCTNESVLHKSFKHLLFRKLVLFLESSTPLNIQWKCETCNQLHSGNLLKKVNKVVEEFNLIDCKPDISLFDKDGLVIAVIEVVVTHKPESKTLDFYDKKSITLIQINLNSELDLLNIDQKVEQPDLVNICLNPICPICGEHKMIKKLITYKTRCKLCEQINMVAYINKHDNSCNEDYCGIWEFSVKDIDLAKSKGVNIKWRKSRQGKWFLNNECVKCNKPLDEQRNKSFWCVPFPPSDIRKMTEDEYYKSLEVKTLEHMITGYYCMKCD